MQSRSSSFKTVSPSALAGPVQWPLSEAYSQKELLRALKPKRRPRPKSVYSARFLIFFNTTNIMSQHGASSSKDQANVQPSPTTNIHDARNNSNIVHDTLDQEDLEFLEQNSRHSIRCKPLGCATASIAVPSSVSPSLATSVKRKFQHVAPCVKGHGLCPKRTWTIDNYCPACHG